MKYTIAKKTPTIANTGRIFMPTDYKLHVLFAFLLCYLLSTTHKHTSTHSFRLLSVSDSEFLPPFFTCAISSVIPFYHTTPSILLRLEFIHALHSVVVWFSLFAFFEMHVYKYTHCVVALRLPSSLFLRFLPFDSLISMAVAVNSHEL